MSPAADHPRGGGSAEHPRGRATPQVQRWIDEAVAVLAANGDDTTRLDPSDIWTIIVHESGGDPRAVNDWDSNAAGGTPSQGIMQTIGPTFAAYALPGHGDIWDPVNNIIAACRYILDRYRTTAQVPGVAALRSGGVYEGY